MIELDSKARTTAYHLAAMYLPTDPGLVLPPWALCQDGDGSSIIPGMYMEGSCQNFRTWSRLFCHVAFKISSYFNLLLSQNPKNESELGPPMALARTHRVRKKEGFCQNPKRSLPPSHVEREQGPGARIPRRTLL